MEKQYERQIREAQQRKEKTLKKLVKQLRAEIFVNAVRLEIAERGALLPEELSKTELTGILVRNVRLFKNLKEIDVAKRSGVAPETISRLEGGQHKPRPETIAKLAKALGVPSKQLDPDVVFGRWPAVYQTIVTERDAVEGERPKAKA